MSGSNIKKKPLKQARKNDSSHQWDSQLNEINKQKFNLLLNENKTLKEIILNHLYENVHRTTINNSSNIETKVKKNDYSFYAKILLSITVIMLSLAFHIVYLSVTSCLYYTNGSSDCWVKSWLGMPVYASFFIDLTLYLLIGFQLILIILILRSKIQDVKLNK